MPDSWKVLYPSQFLNIAKKAKEIDFFSIFIPECTTVGDYQIIYRLLSKNEKFITEKKFTVTVLPVHNINIQLLY